MVVPAEGLVGRDHQKSEGKILGGLDYDGCYLGNGRELPENLLDAMQLHVF